MNIFKKAIWLGGIVFAVGASAASAATLTLQSTFDVALRPAGINSPPGPDVPGLDGATITMTALFSDGTQFVTGAYNTLRAVPTSVEFAVSGASVASTNGVYLPPIPIGLFATGNANDGLLTVGSSTLPFGPNRDASFFEIGNLVNSVRISAGGTVGTAVEGEVLTLDRLLGVQFGSGGTLAFSKTGSGGSNYTISNFTTTAYSDAMTPVPLPAGLPLLLVGLGAFAALRRRANA